MRFVGLAGGWPADDTSSEANGVTSVPAPSPSKAACTTNAPIRSTRCEVPPFTHALRAHPPGGALGAALCGRRLIWRRLRWEASCGQRLNLVARGPGEGGPLASVGRVQQSRMCLAILQCRKRRASCCFAAVAAPLRLRLPAWVQAWRREGEERRPV